MITHLKGQLIELNPTEAVIDVNGVGYLLHISLTTYTALEGKKEAFIYTHLQVREDAHSLYGFITPLERLVFRLLISVSGVGANTARMILSSLSVHEVQQAIASDNVSLLQGVKGIGAKTAQRVIIDLKDKILVDMDEMSISSVSNNTIKIEALSALEVLGFVKKTAEKMIDSMLKEEPDLSLEKLIKNALKRL
ncbi:MAG: Holliday junction DNA helicase RuvA [Candidatus Azotimanducaceae bacterium]|jgi:Holliday junction DNA helicase RuvA